MLRNIIVYPDVGCMHLQTMLLAVMTMKYQMHGCFISTVYMYACMILLFLQLWGSTLQADG